MFVFTIPWENAFVISGVGTVSRFVGLIVLPVGILAILDSGRLRRPCVPLALMGLFVVWGSLGYWWTADPGGTIILLTIWVQNLGMVWLIWELAANREKQLVVMQAYVLGTLISAGDTLFSYLRGKEAVYQRYAGSGFDPNDLGLLLAMSLPLSFYLSTVRSDRRTVWICRLQQIVALFAIGLTSSRAAVIAAAVALVYLPLASLKMNLRQKATLVLFVVIAITCMVAFLPETSWTRWGGIGTELQHGTWDARKDIWAVGLNLFTEHPIRGVGPGGFPAAAKQVSPPFGTHNTFLSILVEEGLFGFGLFLLVLLSLVLPTLRLPGLERALWLVVLATWATGVFTLTWENRKPTWFLFGLLTTWLGTRTGYTKVTHEIDITGYSPHSRWRKAAI